jgi:hypothetical protein
MARDSKWTPILRGDVYCSPRCGFKCKKAAFDRATKEAAKLCAALGKGWKPCVWENWGWHFSASKGVAVIHASTDGSALDGNYTVTGYRVYFNSAHQVVGKDVATPKGALGSVLRTARTLARSIAADCAALS